MAMSSAILNDEIYPGVLNPRESAHWIVENTDPTIMTIDKEALERAAELICSSTQEQLKRLDFAECEVQPKTADKSAVDWIFFIDSINFSFWADQQQGNSKHWEETHKGRTYSGYFAACAAVNRALESGIPLTSAEFMAQIDDKQLAEIFRGDDGSIIPMLKEREAILRQNGQILKEKFQGSFFNCLLPDKTTTARDLLQLIVENFPSFRDFAEYRGKKVSFLKRAQILVADVHNSLQAGNSDTKITNISFLTMFADYRVPQALAHLGVLRYSPDVLERLRSGAEHPLEAGSELEVQIRGFSIAACDLILDRIRRKCSQMNNGIDPAILKRLQQFTAVDVDVWLWLWRREHADEIEKNVPFHRCRSIYY